MALHGMASHAHTSSFLCFPVPDEPARRSGSPGNHHAPRHLRRRTYFLLLMCIHPQGVGCCLRDHQTSPHLGSVGITTASAGVKQSTKVSKGGYTGGGL